MAAFPAAYSVAVNAKKALNEVAFAAECEVAFTLGLADFGGPFDDIAPMT